MEDGFGPAPKGRRAGTSSKRARKPHAVWQMDASELIRLKSGKLVSWLRIIDECSGAVLWTKVFPQGKWLQVPVSAVQAELRLVFDRWGRPAAFRVDNGGPWGSSGDLPPDLALWLLGLGIDVSYNDPHCPTQNGAVENSQGTGKRWAEPKQCASVKALRQGLLSL